MVNHVSLTISRVRCKVVLILISYQSHSGRGRSGYEVMLILIPYLQFTWLKSILKIALFACSFIGKLRLTLLGARENLHFIEFHKNNLHQYKIRVNTKEFMTSTLSLRSVESFKFISLAFVRHIHQ